MSWRICASRATRRWSSPRPGPIPGPGVGRGVPRGAPARAAAERLSDGAGGRGQRAARAPAAGRIRAGRGASGQPVRAGLARHPGRGTVGTADGLRLPDRGSRLRRALRGAVAGAAAVEPRADPARGLHREPGAQHALDGPVARARGAADPHVAARGGHAALPPLPTRHPGRRRVPGPGGPQRRTHHRLRGTAGRGKAGRGPGGAGRAAGHAAGDRGVRAAAGGPARRPCRTRTSPDSSAGRSWRRRWPGSTCSCTPARRRPSARRSRKPWPPACRWWRWAGAGRWTWWIPPARAGSTRRATSRACARGWRTWRTTTASGWRSGAAAYAAVRTRTWPAVCAELVGHYRRAVQVKSRQLDVVARGVLSR